MQKLVLNEYIGYAWNLEHIHLFRLRRWFLTDELEGQQKNYISLTNNQKIFSKNVLLLMSVSICTAKFTSYSSSRWFSIMLRELQLQLICQTYVTNTFCINYKHILHYGKWPLPLYKWRFFLISKWKKKKNEQPYVKLIDPIQKKLYGWAFIIPSNFTDMFSSMTRTLCPLKRSHG